MKDLSPDDRPREKLLRHGAACARRQRTGRARARQRLPAQRRAGRRQRRARCARRAARPRAIDVRRSFADRRHRAGAKAAQVVGGDRARTPHADARAERAVQVRSPRDVAAYLMPRSDRRPTEQVGVVLLDTKHRVMRTAIVAVGDAEQRGRRAARRLPRSDARPARRRSWCFTTIRPAIRARARTTCG